MIDSVRILLVGYQNQDNLGLRYLASTLKNKGHLTRIVTFEPDPESLIAVARQWTPDIIGFSLIFQFVVPEFAVVIKALRENGIKSHLTIGGHYASFEPEALLRRVPELDSVVRFEGEETVLRLATAVAGQQPLSKVPGLSRRSGHEVVSLPFLTGRKHLDSLPWPDRSDISYRDQHIPTASVLASRGCTWNCSFCSIASFYRANGTCGRRRRNPTRIVDEVEHLVREQGVKLILFQDDDFLAGGAAAIGWAHEIASHLVSRKLHRELRFKISCRSDEISPQALLPLVEGGLAHVYLGVESADQGDLKALNKDLRPEMHLRAGEVLRELDLTFDFGFMLLQPWSTFDSVRNNLRFLRDFAGDGWVAAGFCRAMPYVGTSMEQRLREEGRLEGDPVDADYRFLEPGLDVLWNFCLAAFQGRNYGRDATWDLLRGLLFEAHVKWPGSGHRSGSFEAAKAVAAASNGVLTDVTEAALELIERESAVTASSHDLVDLARLARREDALIRRSLVSLRSI